MSKKLALLWLLFVGSAIGQNYATVSAANIHDSGSNLLAVGTISFAPVDQNGNPISYQVGGGGQTINWPVVFPVTAGAFSGQLANGSSTNPLNVCFSVTVKNSQNKVVLGGKGSGYQCVQTATTSFWCAAAACNFDQYFPQQNGIPITPIPPPQANSLGGVYAAQCAAGKINIGTDTTGRPICSSGISGVVWGAIGGTLANQTDLQAALNLLAPLSSPVFVGNPQAPTPVITDASVSVANTQFVKENLLRIVAIGDPQPQVNDSGLIQYEFAGFGGTLTRIYCSTDTSTVGINFDVRSESTPNTPGTSVLASALVCSSTGASTSSFSSATIPAAPNGVLALNIVSVTGTPAIVRIQVQYQPN